MCKGAEYQNYMVGMYVMDGCMPSLQPAGKYQRCIGAFLDVTEQMRGLTLYKMSVSSRHSVVILIQQYCGY